MASEPKLTKPQRDLLEAAGNYGGTTAAESYQPRRKLIEFGYVTIQPGRYSDYLAITPAGRRALSGTSGHE